MAVSLQDICRSARAYSALIQGWSAGTFAGIVGDRNIAALAYNRPGTLGRGHMLLEFASDHVDLSRAAAVFGMTVIEKLNIFQREADMTALLHRLRVGASRDLRVSPAEAIRIVTDATVLSCQCNLLDHGGERTGGGGGSSAQGRRGGGRDGGSGSGRGTPRSLGARPPVFKPPRSSGAHARTRNCSLIHTDLSDEAAEEHWTLFAIPIPSSFDSDSSENTGDSRGEDVFDLSDTSGDGSCSSTSSDEDSSVSSSSTCDSEVDSTSDDSTLATSVSSSCDGSSFESSASSTSSGSDCSTTESSNSTLGSKSGSFSEDKYFSSSDSNCSSVLKCQRDDASAERARSG